MTKGRYHSWLCTTILCVYVFEFHLSGFLSWVYILDSWSNASTAALSLGSWISEHVSNVRVFPVSSCMRRQEKLQGRAVERAAVPILVELCRQTHLNFSWNSLVAFGHTQNRFFNVVETCALLRFHRVGGWVLCLSCCGGNWDSHASSLCGMNIMQVLTRKSSVQWPLDPEHHLQYEWSFRKPVISVCRLSTFSASPWFVSTLSWFFKLSTFSANAWFKSVLSWSTRAPYCWTALRGILLIFPLTCRSSRNHEILILLKIESWIKSFWRRTIFGNPTNKPVFVHVSRGLALQVRVRLSPFVVPQWVLVW